MRSDPTHRLVEALESAGTPLDRGALVERSGLDGAEFESALDHLQGQQVVRSVPDRDAFRLTYWPDQRDCAVCGEEIASGEYYELELSPRETTTTSPITGSLHTACALGLLDDLSLEGADPSEA